MLCIHNKLSDWCVLFQDWQERYIHENYTHIMKDKLIETVSSNTHRQCT